MKCERGVMCVVRRRRGGEGVVVAGVEQIKGRMVEKEVEGIGDEKGKMVGDV